MRMAGKPLSIAAKRCGCSWGRGKFWRSRSKRCCHKPPRNGTLLHLLVATSIVANMSGKLLKEIHKSQPFESSRQEAMLNVIRTADHLMRGFEERSEERRVGKECR